MTRARPLTRVALLGAAALAVLGASAAPAVALPAVQPVATAAPSPAGDPATTGAPSAEGPAARQVSSGANYVVRSVVTDSRIVAANWAEVPAPVVAWGGPVPPGASDSWIPVAIGYRDGQPAYELHNTGTPTLCLQSADFEPGAYLYQQPCDRSDARQAWFLPDAPTGPGTFWIVPAEAPDLTVTPQASSEATYLQLQGPSDWSGWYLVLRGTR